MIITRTPLRISFAGGGTDISDYYKGHGGAVVSAAIDKYIYITNRYYSITFKKLPSSSSYNYKKNK